MVEFRDVVQPQSYPWFSTEYPSGNDSNRSRLKRQVSFPFHPFLFRPHHHSFSPLPHPPLSPTNPPIPTPRIISSNGIMLQFDKYIFLFYWELITEAACCKVCRSLWLRKQKTLIIFKRNWLITRLWCSLRRVLKNDRRIQEF